MPEIDLPANGWQPRPYQLPLWKALEGGKRFAIEIAHRRWGKDEVGLHHTACALFKRPGTYWHLLPEYAQARKAIWTAINPHTGKARIDEAFPPEIRASTNNQEMFIKFRNGSTWQVVGSDNYNSLVGSPPVGLVVSEWALADPAAWGYLRPILLENKGWALFITTPRGRNHAHRMLEQARKDPEHWFAEVSDAVKTGRFTAEELERELTEYTSLYGQDHGHALWDQEYMCSFAAANLGSYYGLLLEQAEREGRIGSAPYDPAQPVVTAWDIGIGDSTSIWFAQLGAGQVKFIDHYEAQGQPLQHYVKVLQSKPYTYSEHIGPHDLNVRDFSVGRSRIEIAAELGVQFTIAPKMPVDDGINAVRQLLPRAWFDRDKCERGLDALRNYRKAWQDKAHDWSDKPAHDWTSHAADAMRYFAISTPLLSQDQYRSPDRYDLQRRRDKRRESTSWMTA